MTGDGKWPRFLGCFILQSLIMWTEGVILKLQCVMRDYMNVVLVGFGFNCTVRLGCLKVNRCIILSFQPNKHFFYL